MVVEDDDDLRELLVLLLEREGFRVLSAVHGREALDLLDETPVLPELVILDLMMPVMGGLEFRRQQLERPRLASIPVVVLSGDRRPPPELARLGVEAVITKPMHSVDPLLRVVHTLCGEREADA